MLWVLANKKTGVIHDFTEFATVNDALEYRDKHLPDFKKWLHPYNLKEKRWATVEDM